MPHAHAEAEKSLKNAADCFTDSKECRQGSYKKDAPFDLNSVISKEKQFKKWNRARKIAFEKNNLNGWIYIVIW